LPVSQKYCSYDHLTDCVKVLRPTRHKSSQPISWLSTEKLNLTQQKTSIHNKIYCNKKTKTRFGCLLWLWPWNGMGLFSRK